MITEKVDRKHLLMSDPPSVLEEKYVHLPCRTGAGMRHCLIIYFPVPLKLQYALGFAN